MQTNLFYLGSLENNWAVVSRCSKLDKCQLKTRGTSQEVATAIFNAWHIFGLSSNFWPESLQTPHRSWGFWPSVESLIFQEHSPSLFYRNFLPPFTERSHLKCRHIHTGNNQPLHVYCDPSSFPPRVEHLTETRLFHFLAVLVPEGYFTSTNDHAKSDGRNMF